MAAIARVVDVSSQLVAALIVHVGAPVVDPFFAILKVAVVEGVAPTRRFVMVPDLGIFTAALVSLV